ncbi:hypothetical protein LOD99_1751 [Oopsacas minuta]|uniref:Importin N-terminal domain-containing protein n=1 Tax=Oopsacas minuta TaxID=111878 RepID=A0AAV7K441_9METZ|nr:hypothetical protein LOD99_1751 [Oopsacas minuta]
MSFDVNEEGLERVLISCLQNSLSPDQQVRHQAEQDLKNLEVSDEFGVRLCSITLKQDVDVSLRQLSTVVLKRYTELHWNLNSEKFIVPEISESSKVIIRQLLPQALIDSSSKVRGCVAYAIATIAHWDWPECWPGLVPALLANLSSEQGSLVHGSIRVFVELARDISEAQINEVLPALLPKLYHIFTNSVVYTSRTRSRSINILTTFIQLLYTISKEYPEAPHKLLFPILPSFLEAFFHFLSSQTKSISEYSLQREVYNCFKELLKDFPKQVLPYFDKLLPVFWICFIQSAQSYLKIALFSSEMTDEEMDSDGNQISLDSILFSQFGVWNALILCKRFHELLKEYLHEFVFHLISLVQVSEETYKSWLNDVSQLVEDEDSVLSSYSVRIYSLDIIRMLEEEPSLAEHFTVAVHSAIEKHTLAAKHSREVGDVNWWKIIESCMLVYRNIISYCEKMKDYNISSLITEILLPSLSSDQPLLTSRALWLTGHLIPLLPIEYINQFLGLIANGLLPEQHIFIRVFSAQTIYQYASTLKGTPNQILLIPFIPGAIQCLGNLASVSLEECDVLSDILYALNQCLQYDGVLPETIDQQIIPVLTTAFTKYNNDPHLGPVIEESFGLIANNLLFLKPLQEKFIPDSIKVIASTNEFLPSMISATMDILSKIIRASPPPLASFFFEGIFVTIVAATLRTDDNSILQSGGECMCAFLAADTEGLIGWQDQEGAGGLHYAVKVIEHILDPKHSEFSAAFVGKLIIMLVRKVGALLGKLLSVILRAVISKLSVSVTPNVMQSLILVFAFLIQSQLEFVLEFLSSLPSSTGKPALDQVMSDWVQLQGTIFGSYDTKMSIVALSKVLTYGIQTQDAKLEAIMVRGDEIFQHGDGIQTRSKTRSRPKQYTEVPLLAKIFKVLIQELGVALESQEVGVLGTSREFDGGEDSEDDGEESSSADDMVDAMLLYGSSSLNDEFEEDDLDIIDEEIAKLDTRVFLTHYCSQFCQLSGFGILIPMLTEKELLTLQDAGVQVSSTIHT